jgi:hypothetical protein
MVLLAMISAWADVRLMNATGQSLTVDLGEEVRGHVLPAKKVFSETLGSPQPDNAAETIVIRDGEGKELARERVIARGNYVIVRHGDGVSIRAAGNFRGRSASSNRVGVINLTGAVVGYRLEYPDLQVSEGKTRDLRYPTDVTYVAAGRHVSPGTKVRLDVTAPGSAPTTTTVSTGGLYQVRKEGTSLIVDPVYVP